MTELLKIILSAILGLGVGVASGILIEKYREKKRAYDAILSEYLNAMARGEGLNDDEWRRFAAVQRAGAWRLSTRELKNLADDVTGRGYADPYAAWRELLKHTEDYPKSFLVWAKRNGVDFADEEATAKAVSAEYSVKVSTPTRQGILLA